MLISSEQVRLDKIELPGHLKEKCQLLVLRLDLIDKITGGNKHFKLKYNLEEAARLGHKTILTFGGAWSNHLAAVAAAVNQFEIIAVVRGEKPEKSSDTLRFCEERGMKLHFVSREEYRRRHDADYIEELRLKFGEFYLLPEGGSNEMAVKGCREIVDLISEKFDVICCPVGSGGTLGGIASGLKKEQMALGFVALKGGEYLEGVIAKLMTPLSLRNASPTGETKQRFRLIHDYHLGAFAKVTPELRAFKKDFENRNGFELDYVYTAKMFFGIYDLIEKNYFKQGSTIVAVHTGGLQGNAGFKE
jgi:1-aminocyclopropane-1-carboxylate deaminase/D-cysteine desulfhydrase-like pyridoxal-dependent ACC family enzyme